MSQIGGNEVTRSLMEQQLKQWYESEADQLIDVGRLKIITLVAGHMLYFSSKSVINTCENLDWKRAFALHLWYDRIIFYISQSRNYVCHSRVNTIVPIENFAGTLQDRLIHLWKLCCSTNRLTNWKKNSLPLQSRRT